jgi:predicted transcriptional regulator
MAVDHRRRPRALMLAVELMVKHGLAELAVTDDGGRVVGVLRDSNVLREMARAAGSYP